MENNYSNSEIEKWHSADIISYALKLAKTDEIEHALEIAALLKKKGNEIESDIYFNVVSEISKIIAVKGDLVLAEKLISKSKMPLVDVNALEDSIYALLTISKEYIKRENIEESKRILSLAKRLFYKRNKKDEAQAILALSLASSFADAGNISEASNLAESAISIADERLAENKKVESFGFEERKIIIAAVLKIAKSLSVETATKIVSKIRNENLREKVNKELLKLK